MKYKVTLILSLIFLAANGAAAQTARKTVTNADLEKFRAERERAEADYRANYEKMGMPSPEELAKREAENSRQREELARRLATERRQREEADALRARLNQLDAQVNYLNGVNQAIQSGGFSTGTQTLWNGGLPLFGTPVGGFGFGNGGFGRGGLQRPGWNNRPIRGGRPNNRVGQPFIGVVPNRPTVVTGGGMVYSIPRPSTVAPPRINAPRANRRF